MPIFYKTKDLNDTIIDDIIKIIKMSNAQYISNICSNIINTILYNDDINVNYLLKCRENIICNYNTPAYTILDDLIKIIRFSNDNDIIEKTVYIIKLLKYGDNYKYFLFDFMIINNKETLLNKNTHLTFFNENNVILDNINNNMSDSDSNIESDSDSNIDSDSDTGYDYIYVDK
jgi:hypothetical protein